MKAPRASGRNRSDNRKAASAGGFVDDQNDRQTKKQTILRVGYGFYKEAVLLIARGRLNPSIRRTYLCSLPFASLPLRKISIIRQECWRGEYLTRFRSFTYDFNGFEPDHHRRRRMLLVRAWSWSDARSWPPIRSFSSAAIRHQYRRQGKIAGRVGVTISASTTVCMSAWARRR